MRIFKVCAGIIGIFVITYVFFTSLSPRARDIILRPADVAIVRLGQSVYQNNCASCHGTNLEGQRNWRRRDKDGYLPAPPHDDSGHTWHHSDILLFEITKFGVGKIAGSEYKTRMPAYEKRLSDAEIIAVLSYIKSRWSVDIRLRHDRLNAAAKR